MSENNKLSPLSETHHAVLFALIARHTIEQFGANEGEAVIRKAIRRYGNQRGKRMAMRAQANSQDLTMPGYLSYGEWQPSAYDIMSSTKEDIELDMRMKVVKCPWNDAWVKYGLIQYGRIYCQEIDDALIKGFNPALTLETISTLSNDGQPCVFIYRDACSVQKESPTLLQKKQSEPQETNTMPWEYHCGHLYKTFNAVLIDEWGVIGMAAIRSALEEFGSIFGKEATRLILGYQETDFDQLPLTTV
jgi:hypothetical protein